MCRVCEAIPDEAKAELDTLLTENVGLLKRTYAIGVERGSLDAGEIEEVNAGLDELLAWLAEGNHATMDVVKYTATGAQINMETAGILPADITEQPLGKLMLWTKRRDGDIHQAEAELMSPEELMRYSAASN